MQKKDNFFHLNLILINKKKKPWFIIFTMDIHQQTIEKSSVTDPETI